MPARHVPAKAPSSKRSARVYGGRSSGSGAKSTTKILVDLKPADQGASGNLRVLREAGEPTHREFVASTCTEVGSALALVAALALDPNARTEPLSSIGASEGQFSPPTAALSIAAPAAVPVPAAVTLPPPAPSPPRLAVASRGYIGWLGPAASVVTGYAPASLALLGLSLGARPAERRGFSPSVQLTPMWGKTGTTGPSASGGTFSWAVARLEGCPARVRLGSSLNLEPCARSRWGAWPRGIGGQDCRQRPCRSVVVGRRSCAVTASQRGPLVHPARRSRTSARDPRRVRLSQSQSARPPSFACRGWSEPRRRIRARAVIKTAGADHSALPVPPQPLSLATTASALARVDEARLRQVVEANFDALWRFLRRLGIAEADVDDAVQEVILVLARKLDQVQTGSERSFVLSTAFRVASDMRRRRKRRAEVDDAPLLQLVSPGLIQKPAPINVGWCCSSTACWSSFRSSCAPCSCSTSSRI